MLISINSVIARVFEWLAGDMLSIKRITVLCYRRYVLQRQVEQQNSIVRSALIEFRCLSLLR